MNTILISIIAIPIIEILLFIKIGENIGAINTILLIIFTAIVGVYFARIQGIRTIKSGFINIYQNKLPIYEILSGASIAIASGEEKAVPNILKNYEFLWRLRNDFFRRSKRIIETFFYYLLGKYFNRAFHKTRFIKID